MRKNDPQKEKRRWLPDHLFKKKNAAQPEESEVQAADPVESPTPETPKSVTGFPAGSVMTQAWQKWRGDSEPLFLTLTGNGNGCKLNIDTQRLMLETALLSTQLEQDAKNYLERLESAEAGSDLGTEIICRTYVSADRMAAWMFLFPPFRPQDKVQLQTLTESLEQSGVTTGIDPAAINYLYQKQPYFELVPLACGTLPVEGTDGSVKELYPRQVSNEVKIDEHGTADYHTRNYMQPVQKGDVICDIIPPREGVAGVCVDGQVIHPRPVKAEKVVPGANTALTEDGLHLIAKIDGHLEYSQSSFAVRAILEIDGDVNYGTGNIEYHGDVHVRGNVCEGFSVRAAGAVIVDGVVEAATVEAGGDVTVTNGILGDNRALVKSRCNVRAKYLENCVVYAGESVYTDCAMSSQIFSDQNILATSGRGTIIGGTLTAGKAIKARVIGSKSGRKTDIVLGVLPYVEQERIDGEADLEEIRKEMEKLEKEIRSLGMQSGMNGASSQLAKANLRKSVLAMKEQRVLKRREKLEVAKPDLSMCRLECSLVYPVTNLAIQEYSYCFEDVKNSCIATFDAQNREIKIR